MWGNVFMLYLTFSYIMISTPFVPFLARLQFMYYYLFISVVVLIVVLGDGQNEKIVGKKLS